jgi:uncharacterized protein DUF4129
VLLQEYAQSGGPDQARALAEEILEASAYSKVSHELDTPEIWADWYENWRQLQDSVDDLRVSSPDSYFLLITILVAMLALIIWQMVWSVRRSNRYVGWQIDEPVMATGQNPEMLLVDAGRQALADGKRIEALSLRFRLALYRHARNHPGVLRPGWTNRECLKAWSNKPETMASMAEVVKLLDQCWYAQQECQPEDFERAWAVLEDKQIE